MNDRDPFEQWSRGRRDAPVPEGFADRVMQAIRKGGALSPARSALSDAFHGLLAYRLAAAALLAAGLGVGLFRAGLLLAYILVSPGTGF